MRRHAVATSPNTLLQLVGTALILAALVTPSTCDAHRHPNDPNVTLVCSRDGGLAGGDSGGHGFVDGYEHS